MVSVEILLRLQHYQIANSIVKERIKKLIDELFYIKKIE